MKGDKAAAAAKSSPEWRSWRETSLGDKAAAAAKGSPEWRSCRGTNEGTQRETMKGHKGRQGGSGITTIWRFWGSATQSLRSKNPYSFQLSGEWRETNEEGRLGAAAISVISMQGDKWRRETRSGSDFGNQHAERLGISMQGDKWRREILGISMQGDKWRETTEEAVILGISMQGDKGRETNEEAVILGISMQGDKWSKTNEEGRFWKSACRETNEGRKMKKGHEERQRFR